MPRTKRPPAPVQRLAVAYARYSDIGQREVSIEQQLQDIRAFAAREGYTIIHEYVDKARSGYKRTASRVAFNDMLNAAETGAFGIVITWKVDRFGRNREESAIYKGRLRRFGIRVLYAMEPIPEGAVGTLLEGMLEATAEWYSRNLSENVSRGMYDNAHKCLHNGVRIYGYSHGADGHFAVNPAEASIVRNIYDLRESGHIPSQIVDLLNGQGLTTSTGRAFVLKDVLRILRDERYTGMYQWSNIRVPGGMPVIIQPAQYERVNILMENQKKRVQPTGVDFALTGKLYCGLCGHSMVGDSGKSHTGSSYYYYSCVSRKNRKACPKRSIRKDVIEEQVLNFLFDQLMQGSFVDRIADAVLAAQAEEGKTSIASGLEADRREVARKINNINNAIAEGIFTSSTKEKLIQLEADLAKLDEAIANIEFSRSQLISREHVIFWLEKLKAGDRSDPIFRSLMVDTFINSVFLFDDHFTICINASSQEHTVTLAELDENAKKENQPEPNGSADFHLVHHMEPYPNFLILRRGRVIAFNIML